MKKKFFFCFFRNKTATTTTENVTLFRKIKIERSYKGKKTTSLVTNMYKYLN